MAPSNPKLSEELSTLTNEANTAITELSTPSHITSPQTPRWLSLTSFKSVPIQYKWETELEAEIEEAVFSDEEDSESYHSISRSISHSTTSEERGRSRKRAWSLSSSELPSFEKATCRILAVLKCYVYNLSQGMLVTGSKVDERVEGALLRLLGKKLEGGGCGGEKGEGEMGESWEISDEERVVAEIELYGQEVKRSGEKIPADVESVAKEILNCSRTEGTINGLEDMVNLRESFEFIEC